VAAIALLAKILATPRAKAAPTAHPTKLREPDTFDGSNANKLRTFIFQCSLHFQDQANIFSNDLAKSHMPYPSSQALPWAGSSQHYSKGSPHHGSPTGTCSIMSWKIISAHSTQ